jgi:hypothetical protein
MIPRASMQKSKLIPNLGLIDSVVVDWALARKRLLTQRQKTFPTPHSFTNRKGPSLVREVGAKDAPPVYQCLPTARP